MVDLCICSIIQLFNRFSVIEDRIYVNTRLKVEKALSEVEEVMGIVRYNRNNLWVSVNISL